ncbi:toxin-antitoxin system, toxin component [bacterium]|nr:MAG: toxin-antitoxin system, toxin component [bacterium]
MKKLILIVGLLLLISISLSADDIMRPEKITLEQFTQEYIPDYILKKRIPLECRRVMAFAVAKNTGNIVTVTQELIPDTHKLQTVVNYFDIDGNLLWKKPIEGILTQACAITDNGELITTYGHFERYSSNNKSIVLSNKGDILCTGVFDSAGLVPSQDGKYLYFNKGTSDSKEAKGFKLFDKNFEQVNVTGFDFDNLSNIDFTFVSDNKIIMYAYDTIESQPYYYLLKIDSENKITLLWKHKTVKQYKNFPTYFYDDVKTHKDKMIINTMYSPVYVFNFAGDLLYKDDEIHLNNIAFIDDENIYLHRTVYKPKIVNLKTKDVKIKQETSLPGLQSVFVNNGNIIFQERSATSILDINAWTNFTILPYISKNVNIKDVEYYILVQSVNNPELVIYERSSK